MPGPGGLVDVASCIAVSNTAATWRVLPLTLHPNDLSPTIGVCGDKERCGLSETRWEQAPTRSRPCASKLVSGGVVGEHEPRLDAEAPEMLEATCPRGSDAADRHAECLAQILVAERRVRAEQAEDELAAAGKLIN
jgi:hypothetical protein